MDIFSKSTIRDFFRKAFVLWFKRSRALFAVFFFFVIGFGALVWYDNVYHGNWTEEERQSYAKANFQETVFRESEFRRAVEAAEKRAAQHAEESDVSKDFFTPLPGVRIDRK